MATNENSYTTQELLRSAEELRPALGDNFRDEIVNSLYREAEVIAKRAVKSIDDRKYDLDQRIDRIVTNPFLGLPLMGLLLAGLFYITIQGANVFSEMIGNALFWVG